MNNILRKASIAALLFQCAVSANADDFYSGDFYGTYGYSLSGESGELAIRHILTRQPTGEQFITSIVGGITASIPNFVTEVGTFKADGYDEIFKFSGKTFVSVNLAGNKKKLTFKTTYDCSPFKLTYKGTGKMNCKRSDQLIPDEDNVVLPQPLERKMLISFVIDDIDKEIRLHERQLPFKNDIDCMAITEEQQIRKPGPLTQFVFVTANSGNQDPIFQEEITEQQDPLCFLDLIGSATRQQPVGYFFP